MRSLNEVAKVRQFREGLRVLSDRERAVLVRELGDDFADSWEIRARDEQLPPAGDWWCAAGASRRQARKQLDPRPDGNSNRGQGDAGRCRVVEKGAVTHVPGLHALERELRRQPEI